MIHLNNHKEGYRTWDPWIFKDDDIYRVFYLIGHNSVTPFWNAGEIASAISKDLKIWEFLGICLKPNPDNHWESGRILAGNIYKENGIYYLFYSASPSQPLILQEEIGLASSSDGIHWLRKSSIFLGENGNFYGSSRPNSTLQHRQWRDPYILKDPQTSKYYMFTSASAQEGDFNYRGCVGLSVADKIDGPYEALPPAVYPKLQNKNEGIYYELERPQVIYKNNKYYLFFSCWQHTLNPKWLEELSEERITDSSLYCYVSDKVTGPYKPINPKPVVIGSEYTGLYGTNLMLGTDGQFFAYGWYPQSFTLEISQRFKVSWEGNNIEIFSGSCQKTSDLKQQIMFDTKQPNNIPLINLISDKNKKPFWSVMIPTYNCANYLVKTLESVLAQDPGSEQMQIEVVDDYSTKDDPEAIVREIGQGRVSFFRQSQNVGATANFNTCIQRAKGEWVHILHGDDAVLAGFYSQMQQSIESEPNIGAAFCRCIFIDENNNWKHLSPLYRETAGIFPEFWKALAITNRITTPSIIVKRSVYEKLGGFNPQLRHTADWEMWTRIGVHYQLLFEPLPLAFYREHSASDTSRLVTTGANIIDTLSCINIFEHYLPSALSTELTNKAKEVIVIQALDKATVLFSKGDIQAAINQIREGLKCSTSSMVLRSFANFLVNNEALFKLFVEMIISSKDDILSSLSSPHQIDEYEEKLEVDLRDINLIIFPDWQLPEELVYENLKSIIEVVIKLSNQSNIALLIDSSNGSEEEINLMISDIIFQMFQENELDSTGEPTISFVNNLSDSKWQVLLNKLKARIVLKYQNNEAISKSGADQILSLNLKELKNVLG